MVVGSTYSLSPTLGAMQRTCAKVCVRYEVKTWKVGLLSFEAACPTLLCDMLHNQQPTLFNPQSAVWQTRTLCPMKCARETALAGGSTAAQIHRLPTSRSCEKILDGEKGKVFTPEYRTHPLFSMKEQASLKIKNRGQEEYNDGAAAQARTRCSRGPDICSTKRWEAFPTFQGCSAATKPVGGESVRPKARRKSHCTHDPDS